MLCISSPFTDPYFNLATEEFLLQHFTDDIFMLWRNEPAIIVGKFQNTAAEINLDFVKEKNIKVVRRLTGGGAVFHDLGNLCFSFISHEKIHNITRQLSVIAAACRTFGIDAKPTGRNDVEADGRKFSGNAFYSAGENKCHHGTVLISADKSRLANYLTVSKTKLEAKGIKSVRSRVVNLTELVPEMTVEAFEQALIAAFAPDMTLPMPNEALYTDRAEFLGSREWLLGSDPEFTDEIKYRTAEGEFTLHLTVKGERITDCAVYTDSLDTEAAERIRKEVVGKRFEEMQNAKGKMQN